MVYKDKDIYMFGIENESAVSSHKRSFLEKFSIVLYYLGLVLFCRVDRNKYKSFYFVGGTAEFKWKTLESADKMLYRGSPRKIGDLRGLYTFVSPFSRRKRISTFFQALKRFQKDDRDYFARRLEFCFLSRFVREVKPKKLITRGHFDCMTTWMSLLMEEQGGDLVIYQHGVVNNAVKIPNKLSVAEFHGFDNYSIETFRNLYVKEGTKCSIFPFCSNVCFRDIPKNGRLIGIAEQLNPKWVESVVASINRAFDDVQIVIMLHPLSSRKYALKNCISIKDFKVGNIEALITESSTLAIDYYYHDNSIKVFYTSADMKDCFSDYPFIYFGDVNLLGDGLLL